MKKIFLFFIFQICFFTLKSQSDYYHFEELSTENGFPTALVWTMLQDSKGFMWFGAQEGLIRYDGINYKIFYPEKQDSTKLNKGNVHYLFEDSKGKIWLSCGMGINNVNSILIFNPKLENFTSLPIDIYRNYFVTHILRAQNYFLEDKYGNIWIKCYRNGLYKVTENLSGEYIVTNYQPEKKQNSNSATTIFNDSKNRLWVGTPSGLFQFDKNNEIFIQYDISQKKEGSRIIGIIEDSDGMIWLCNNGKLFSINPETGNKIDELSIKNHFQDSIKYIVKDKFDNIWMLSYNLKLNNLHIFRYNIKSKESNSYPMNDFLTALPFLCQIQIDKNGKCNVYADNKFLYFDYESQSFTEYCQKENNQDLYNFYIDNDQNIWYSSRGKGVFKFHPSNQKFKVFKHDANDPLSISNNLITFIYEDSNLDVWIGYLSGLDRFSWGNNNQIIKKKTFLRGITCGNAVQDNEGYILVTSYDTSSLIKIDPAKEHVTNFYKRKRPYINISKPSSYLNEIHRIDSGQFLISTHNIGIVYFNSNTNKYKHFTSDLEDPTSISGNFWTVIETDKSGNIYVANQTGVDKFDIDDEKFTRINGINNEIDGRIQDLYILF